MTSKSAHGLASLAGRLRKLPVCAAAFGDGTLAKGQVEVIVAKLDDATIDAFAEAESELVPYLAPLTLAGCARAMAAWKEQVEEAEDSAEPQRSLHLSATLDGRHVIEGHLDAEGGAVVATALRLATVEDPELSPAQRPRGREPVLPRPPAVDPRTTPPSPSQRGRRPRRPPGMPRRSGRRRTWARRAHGLGLAVRLQPAPGPDQGPLRHPRLRHLDEDRSRHPVERTGHSGRGIPLPGLRPSLVVVRGPSRALGHPRRADRDRKPRQSAT